MARWHHALRQRARAFSGIAASGLPPSPLVTDGAPSAATAPMRTAFTHLFSRQHDIDRSIAADFRAHCRSGEFTGQTSGWAPGFVQANLVALPKEHAFDFLRFCLQNPRACPLLDVTAPGDPHPRAVAPAADLRTDVPRYRVWRDGEAVEEASDVTELWSPSMVGFLLGCSFSWEGVLAEAGLTPRHVEQRCNVPMYRTSVANAPVGPFGGALVASMRPYRPEQIQRVAALTARYPGAHGGPIHWGDPSQLGVTLDGAPDWGEEVSVAADEVPVFWACGVTPQEALREARLPLAITHAPGHMLVCDLKDSELEVEAGR